MAVEPIGITGSPYNTNVPALSENADIQAALRIYHYGSNTDDPQSIPSDSIAGHLAALEASKVTGDPTQINGTSSNLNDYITTGYYSQSSNTNARSGTNYPTYDSTQWSGILTVINEGSLVVQSYQIIENNVVFTRTYTGSAWTTWKQLPDSTHTHDTRYYTKTDADTLLATKQPNLTGAATTIASSNLDASKALASNSSGKVVASTVTSNELSYLSGTTSSVQNQLDAKPNSPANTLFVQQSTPTVGVQDGDLWFW